MSFLSRLAGIEPEHELDAIARNLEALLNTRKGVGSVVQGYGLGDYEAHWNTPDLVRSLIAEIEAGVRRYEPRIADPRVAPAARDAHLWIRFVLSGTVAGAPQAFHLDMDTKHRRVVVSRARRWTPSD
jgi:type VI secretion system protein